MRKPRKTASPGILKRLRHRLDMSHSPQEKSLYLRRLNEVKKQLKQQKKPVPATDFRKKAKKADARFKAKLKEASRKKASRFEEKRKAA